MHYLESDLKRLFSGAPYWSLKSKKGVQSLLTQAIPTGEALIGTLKQYPLLRYEPLDFHYLCLQSLAVQEPTPVEDLLSYPDWHGVLWGVFLACLSPCERYRPLLEAALARTPHQSEPFTLALDILNGHSDVANICTQFEELRAQLAACSVPAVSLQQGLTDDEKLQRQERVRDAYRKSGFLGARAALVGAS